MFIGNTKQASKIWIGAYVVPTPDQNALKWMPLTSSNHWQVSFGGVLVGTTEITLTQSKHVIFDSGTSLTYVP